MKPHNVYNSVARFDVSEVFELLKQFNTEKGEGKKPNKKVLYKGFTFKIDSLRLHTFKKRGLKCATCDNTGSYFSLESDVKQKVTQGNPHLNLYTASGMLMTKDHIIPKSKGGKDNIANLQTMCYECNQKKGDTMP